MVEQIGSGSGAALRAGYEEWLARASDHGLVPEHPRHDGITAQRVPPPARLDPDAGMERKVSILLACYRGAVQARTGKRSGVFLRGGVRKSRYWGALCGSVKALQEHDIAPAAWAAWSVDLWHAKEDKKAPPLMWVWGAKRIEDRRGWFRRTSDDSTAVGLLWADRAKRLVTAWDRMERLLWTEWDGVTTPDVADALGSVLGVPADRAWDEWRGLHRRALRDIDDATKRLKAASATGEVWLWG